MYCIRNVKIMTGTIFKLVRDFKKNLKKDKGDDENLNRMKDMLKTAIDIDNEEAIITWRCKIKEYTENDSAYEKFILETCDTFVKALSLQESMNKAAENAGFINRNNSIKQSNNNFLITIELNKKINWNDFYNLTQRYISRRFFIRYYAVYLQSGKSYDNLGDNYSFVILCECKYPKTKVNQDTTSTFHGLDVNINIDTINNNSEWSSNMILLKNDSKNVWTNKWKNILGLPEYYSNNILLISDHEEID